MYLYTDANMSSHVDDTKVTANDGSTHEDRRKKKKSKHEKGKQKSAIEICKAITSYGCHRDNAYKRHSPESPLLSPFSVTIHILISIVYSSTLTPCIASHSTLHAYSYMVLECVLRAHQMTEWDGAKPH